MKIRKSVLAVALSVSLVIGCTTTVSAAELKGIAAPNAGQFQEVGSSFTGETVPTEEEYQAYLESLSQEELSKIAEKENLVRSYAANRVQTRAGTKISIPGTFNMYQQEEGNYCVPATIKSMLVYLTGSSPSQSQIFSILGGDEDGVSSVKMPGYLNDRQSQVYYVYKGSPSQTSMCDSLYTTIKHAQAPASMGISGTTTSNWYYLTNGHSLVVNAIYDDYSYIQFGDPLGERTPGCPYFYLKSASLAHDVCTRMVY